MIVTPAEITVENVFERELYRSIIMMLDAFPKGLERKHLVYELTEEIREKKAKKQNKKEDFISIFLKENRVYDYTKDIKKLCSNSSNLSKYLQKLKQLGIIIKDHSDDMYKMSEKFRKLIPIQRNLELLEEYKDKILSELQNGNAEKKTFYPCYIDSKVMMIMKNPHKNYIFEHIEENKNLVEFEKIDEYRERFVKIKKQLFSAIYELDWLITDMSVTLYGAAVVSTTDDNLTVIMNTRVNNYYKKIFKSKYSNLLKDHEK